jgi:hypothetical protein
MYKMRSLNAEGAATLPATAASMVEISEIPGAANSVQTVQDAWQIVMHDVKVDCLREDKPPRTANQVAGQKPA